MQKLGVCIVGCGWISNSHAKAYMLLRNRVRLFTCDLDEAKAKGLALKYGAERWFNNYEEVLTCRDIDAVDICLPHDKHEEVVVAAAKAGKHILCEKPIARTLAEADRMINEAKKAGVKLMVAENFLFYPPLLKAEELVDMGVIGEPFLIQAYSLQHFTPPGWRRFRGLMGGGVLIDRGIHMVALLHYLGGEVESVYGFAMRKTIQEMEGEDTVLAVLKFKSGVVGEILVSWGMPGMDLNVAPLFAVYGNRGTMYERNGLYLRTSSPQRTLGGKVESLIKSSTSDGIAEEIEHFIDCITYDREPIASGEIGRKHLEIVLAIYRSAESGSVIKLPLEWKSMK